MSEGYILISTGPEKYFDMAVQAAKSMRLFDPMRPICIACDDRRLLDSQKASIFTNKFLIPEDMLHLKGTEFHLFVNRMSPFDRTMYVDADCLIASSRITAIWESLKEYHVTFPGIERSSGFWRLEIQPLIERFGLEFIVQLNGGIFYFDKSPEAEEFFSVAQDFFINHRDIATVKHRKGGGFSNESIWGLTMAKTQMKIYPPTEHWNVSTLKWIAWRIDEEPLTLYLTKEDSTYQPAICHFIGLGQGHCPNDLYAEFSKIINTELRGIIDEEDSISMSMSSPNTISGDGLLDDAQKLAWLIANLAQSHQPQPSIPNVKNFHCSLEPYPAKHCDVLMTPSRILSNLFWQNLPAEAIANELGKLRLLDCGCGKGIYFPIIDQSLGGVESYTGVDIKKRNTWIDFQKDPRVTFVQRGAEEIDHGLLEDKTLIVSQSALEHFPYDLTFFQNVADALRLRDYPTLQIHLLPTGTMWRQYGPHGFRGYVPANLATILDMFKDFSRSHVFTLGGKNCLDVHYRYVHDTLSPEMPDRRRAHKDEYARATKAAIEADMTSQHIDIMDACFLALVIHSHPRRKIF